MQWAQSAVDALRTPVSSRSVSRREALTAGALLGLVAVAVYLQHVFNGGWYLDDWVHAGLMAPADNVFEAFDTMNDSYYRPVQALSFALLHAIGGESPSGYLATGIALTTLQAWLFYLALRHLRLGIEVAALAALLFLVLPCIDATRLWAAALPIQVAGILFLAGVLAALRGMDQASRRRRIAWHGVAFALYVMSMLTYELTLGLVAVAPVLYAAYGGWRPALRRMPADYLAIGAALAVIVPRAVDERGADTSLGHLWDRAVQTWTPAEQVFRSLLPWSDVLSGPVGLLALLAGAIGVGLAVRRRDAVGEGFLAWLKIGAVALVLTAAGLIMLLPADAYFVPRVTGLGNRVSAFAAFGAVLLLMTAIVLTVGGIGVLLRRPRWALAVALVLIGGTTVNLALREVDQQQAWADSWSEQQAIVATITGAMGDRLRDDTAVVSFRHTTFILPDDVSVFGYSWDLRAALQHTRGEMELQGHPWTEGSQCAAQGVVFSDGTGAPTGVWPYDYAGRLFFLDVPTGTAVRVRDRASCEEVVAKIALAA